MAAKTPTTQDVSTMTFAQLMGLAQTLKVKGRSRARLEALRAAVAAALPEPRPADDTVIETTFGKIRAGSVIVASAWIGPDAQYTVETVEHDIKNGRPGWEAGDRWGYADQVVRVLKF